MRRIGPVAASLALVATLATPTLAQQDDEPALAALREAVSHSWLTLGALLTTTVDVGLEDAPTSASIAAARLLLGGTLDGGFSYFLQTNFASSASLLDARIGWAPTSRFNVYVGRFKTPYSRELLAYLGDLDFVLRSRVVDALAPNRQIGAQATGRFGSHVALTVGGFSGSENATRNESLVGVARLEGSAIEIAGGRLSVAAQAAVGRDGAIVGRTYPTDFEGDGMLWGGDARYERGPLMLSGEFHHAEWEPLGAADADAEGWFATAGWMVTPQHQLLARFDRWRPPAGVSTDYALFGYNFWPTSVMQVLVNWWAPIDDGLEHRLLVNAELRF